MFITAILWGIVGGLIVAIIYNLKHKPTPCTHHCLGSEDVLTREDVLKIVGEALENGNPELDWHFYPPLNKIVSYKLSSAHLGSAVNTQERLDLLVDSLGLEYDDKDRYVKKEPDVVAKPVELKLKE